MCYHAKFSTTKSYGVGINKESQKIRSAGALPPSDVKWLDTLETPVPLLVLRRQISSFWVK